jgi:hypothetical protein
MTAMCAFGELNCAPAEERDHHDAEAQLQRSKITGALRKSASPPCGKRANQSAQRSQDEIGLIAKAKLPSA